jgi:hypothetical protein
MFHRWCVSPSSAVLPCLKYRALLALCAFKRIHILLYQKVLRAALWHPCCTILTVHSGVQCNTYRGRDIPNNVILPKTYCITHTLRREISHALEEQQ